MIINGGARGAVGFWSKHLTNTEDNDRAEVKEIYGLSADNLPDALREMQAISMGSRCEGNFLYVADINPRDHERLTEAQWKEAVDTLENHLGLSGHQRIVVEHEKEGRAHRHVVWNRVDVETLRVTDIGGNYYTHERVARDLEIKLGLQRTQSLHGEQRPDGRPERAEELWENRAAEKTGIDAKDIRADLTDLWRKTDSGRAFAAALDERGYILAHGDRRAFVVVDHAGTVHSLARRIEDVKAKDVQARLADIDRASLPSAEDAKAMQRDKYPTPEQAREAWKAGMKEPDRVSEPQPEAKPEKTPQGEKWHQRDATKMEERIFKIQDAAERGGASVAAGLYAEGITLARVDTKGKADMDAAYRQEFENAKLQDVRQGTHEARLRRTTFAEGELVAVTRTGSVYRLNPRFIDTDRLERAATGGSDRTPTLSAAQEFFAGERQQWKEDRAAARETIKEAKETQRGRAQTAHDIKGGVKDAVHELKGGSKGFKVFDGKGAAVSLGSFVESLFGMGAASHAPDQQNAAPQTGRGGNFYEAMEDIWERSQRGEDLSAESIRNLPPAHLENLRSHGDAYMHNLIRDFERERENEVARSWEEYDHSRMGRER